MSKFTDALRIAIEPLRFLIDKNSRRIDELESTPTPAPISVQSDMAQSDPEAPDYIKNRIVYDDRGRVVVFEGDVMTSRYAGDSYSSGELNFALEADALYEIEYGGKLYMKRCEIDDSGYYVIPVNTPPLVSLRSWSRLNESTEVRSTDRTTTPSLLKVSKVDKSKGFKMIPKHLVPEYAMADGYTAGIVKVDHTENGINTDYVLRTFIETNSGVLYTENPLPPFRQDKQTIRWNANYWTWDAEDGCWFKSTNGEYYHLSFDDRVPVFRDENRNEIWTPGNFLPYVSSSDAGKIPVVQSDGSWGMEEALIVSSSTKGSKKKFRLTVDDNGLITAQEIA